MWLPSLRRVVRQPGFEDPVGRESVQGERGAAPAAATAAGIRPTSSPAAIRTPWSSHSSETRSTTRCSATASMSVMFMLTWARPVRARSRPSACTPVSPPLDSRTAAATDRATFDVRGVELEVERDEGRARADEDGPGSGIESRRAVVGDKLAGSDPLLQHVGSATPEEHRPPAAADVAVEKDGKPEIVADPSCELVGHRRGAWCVLGLQRDDRYDIGCADARVDALVLAEVDPLGGGRDAGEEGFEQHLVLADEREDRPVVVGVAVDVEHTCPARLHGCRDSCDDRGVATVGDVRDGLEETHASTLRRGDRGSP